MNKKINNVINDDNIPVYVRTTTDQIQLICNTEKQFDMVNDIFNKNKTELVDVEIWDEGKNQKWIVTYQIAGNSARILN